MLRIQIDLTGRDMAGESGARIDSVPTRKVLRLAWLTER